MKTSILSLGLMAATSAHALWLCTVNRDYYNNAAGGVFPSPFCQVGKGNNREQAWSKATDTFKGILIIAGGHCDQLAHQHTNQLGGFWDDYGTINYEDSNWHWYCNTGGQGCCDGGRGAPKKKRAVELES